MKTLLGIIGIIVVTLSLFSCATTTKNSSATAVTAEFTYEYVGTRDGVTMLYVGGAIDSKKGCPGGTKAKAGKFKVGGDRDPSAKPYLLGYNYESKEEFLEDITDADIARVKAIKRPNGKTGNNVAYTPFWDCNKADKTPEADSKKVVQEEILPEADLLKKRLPDFTDYLPKGDKGIKGDGALLSMAYKQVYHPRKKVWLVQRSFYNGCTKTTVNEHPPTDKMNSYWEKLHITKPQFENPADWKASYWVLWCLEDGQWVLCEGGQELDATSAINTLKDTPGVTLGKTADGKNTISCNGDAIGFDFDSFEIKKESFPVLGNVLNILKGEKKVQVIGHTDPDGKPDYNLDLSKNRAQAVANWLEKMGIPETHLEIIGMGETQLIPGALNAKQRRVVFKY